MGCRPSSPVSRLLVCALPALCAVMLTPGCGNSKVETRSTSVGQELQDLDAARNKGLLTEDEYNKKRREIMDSK